MHPTLTSRRVGSDRIGSAVVIVAFYRGQVAYVVGLTSVGEAAEVGLILADSTAWKVRFYHVYVIDKVALLCSRCSVGPPEPRLCRIARPMLALPASKRNGMTHAITFRQPGCIAAALTKLADCLRRPEATAPFLASPRLASYRPAERHLSVFVAVLPRSRRDHLEYLEASRGRCVAGLLLRRWASACAPRWKCGRPRTADTDTRTHAHTYARRRVHARIFSVPRGVICSLRLLAAMSAHVLVSIALRGGLKRTGFQPLSTPHVCPLLIVPRPALSLPLALSLAPRLCSTSVYTTLGRRLAGPVEHTSSLGLAGLCDWSTSRQLSLSHLRTRVARIHTQAHTRIHTHSYSLLPPPNPAAVSRSPRAPAHRLNSPPCLPASTRDRCRRLGFTFPAAHRGYAGFFSSRLSSPLVVSGRLAGHDNRSLTVSRTFYLSAPPAPPFEAELFGTRRPYCCLVPPPRPLSQTQARPARTRSDVLTPAPASTTLLPPVGMDSMLASMTLQQCLLTGPGLDSGLPGDSAVGTLFARAGFASSSSSSSTL
ncbi:unnamed protein product, partial [Protopolystoma xenopodis]